MPLSPSDRSVESTGTDLVLEPLGDLVVDLYGDLVTQSGEKSIVDSLMRRLHTPVNGYRRWIRTVSGLKEVGIDYGNRIYSYLSSPITGPVVNEIKAAVKECAEKDNRIKIQSIEVKKTALNAVEVDLTYYIKGNSELKTLLTDLSLFTNV